MKSKKDGTAELLQLHAHKGLFPSVGFRWGPWHPSLAVSHAAVCNRTFSAVAQALVVRCAGGEYAGQSLVDRLPHRSAALPPLEGSHSWWS